MAEKPLSRTDALLDVIDMQRVVLEEIAYGNVWGGPDQDHIKYMRSIAVDVLEHGSTKNVIQ